MSESMELLVDYETYELNAVHIGTQQVQTCRVSSKKYVLMGYTC